MYASLDDKFSEPKTMENLAKMESRGLHPLPVWHASTGNFDDLKLLLDKYDYIAIGAIV